MKLVFLAISAILLIGISGLILQWTSTRNGGGNSGYTNIGSQEAKTRLSQEKNIVLLDVRSPEEYQGRHIPKSILLPLPMLEQEALHKIPDKNTPVIVYCQTGRRSVSAANILGKLGYTEVYNLGGINKWPYETESGPPR